ncbi:hypothetical protein [Actinomadura roseirufa]|uniref:hypothetical protein n=1 Tax=Actinomadura roseirufa TaxID=2094049 RepID=UPI0013F15086|nr:hypothetical protein [Actinomadura roseirufa]
MSDAFERLDELAALIERRFPHIAPIRPTGASILYLLRRGEGALYVLWDREKAAYAWYGPSGRGPHLGPDAPSAVEAMGRELPPIDAAAPGAYAGRRGRGSLTPGPRVEGARPRSRAQQDERRGYEILSLPSLFQRDPGVRCTTGGSLKN